MIARTLQDIVVNSLQTYPVVGILGSASPDLLRHASESLAGRIIYHELAPFNLAETDHDHLGKVLTYLVNLDAKTAIWVTSNPRAEHQKVIEWLNEASPNDTSFYLVKVEAIETGNDAISPLFTILAKPDGQSKKIGQEKKDWEQLDQDRMDYWRALLANRAIQQTSFA